MTNLLRLLLLLLMGSSLLAARWADGLGQRPSATAILQPRQALPAQAWVPYSWAGWTRPAAALAPAGASQQVPVARAL